PHEPAPVEPAPLEPAPLGPGPAETGPLEQAAPASGKGVSRGEVRVYNNSTIRGLAARAAQDLSAAGWTVVEVGNYPWGIIPTTTVYYQDGTDQRAGAEAIAAEFGMRAEPRFSGIAQASPGIIVIVTNDYRH
ncbi:MAG: LytR C-terminal domain-containing protein, partial [Pseudonocardiales bacterium]|nr:LytR C-terminal domain-containing protein [Pseudonocardiales bacterium]